ncbi:MAG: hypothetical protein LBU90_08685 [Bacteroidales bacterium]|jgi:hypothetical protein|nr:hypothetical protein [Bacteroidales bacterium]
MKKTKYLVLGALLSISVSAFAQKNSDKQVEKTRTEYVEKFDRGDAAGKKMDTKIEYNERGKEVKESDYKDGKLEKYTVYTYLGGKKSGDKVYDASNKLISRSEYEYNANGDRIKKTTYNAAGKIIKVNTYVYEYYE